MKLDGSGGVLENIQTVDAESSSTSMNVMMTSRNCTLQEVMF